MKITNFQLVVFSVITVFVIFAVLIFSGAVDIGNKKESTSYSGKIVVWGTLPSSVMREALSGIESAYDELSISYVQKNEETFGDELAEAMASLTGPDVFFVSNETLLSESNKIFITPYETYPLRSYNSIFVDGAEIFLNDKGVMAYPFTIDPLVLYWNKDIFNANGVVTPPVFWEELYSMSTSLTKRTANGTITQSAISFGTFDNITHAKEIISALVMQGGDYIVRKNSDGTYTSVFGGYLSGTRTRPAESVLRFYTEFANPTSNYYSWNSSLPASYSSFIAGDLAMYIGYSSEIYGIRERNPNLNFDVTRLPQLEGSPTPTTFGKIYGTAVSKSTKNLGASIMVAQSLSGKDTSSFVSTKLSTIPTRRDLLVSNPDDPFAASFYQSALIAKAWYDPDTLSTESIFRTMINDVTSGFLSVGESVSKASESIGRLLK